jgi:hypothetical protein
MAVPSSLMRRTISKMVETRIGAKPKEGSPSISTSRRVARVWASSSLLVYK